MERVVEMGHGLVGAVDGQGVLDQVVGADGEKLQPLDEGAERHGRRRHLDHAAHLDMLVKFCLALAQLALGLFDHGEGLDDLAGMGEHGDQEAHLAELGGAQDGAQLGEEDLRLGQAVTDRAQAERRIRLDALGPAQGAGLLVGADVESANGYRLAGHGLDHGLVGLELLFLVGNVIPVHEQEFGAIQAYPIGIDAFRVVGVLRHLDIHFESDVDAVKRRGAGGAQPVQLGAFQLQLGLAQLVFLQDARVRLDDEHAARAVDDQQIVLLNQRARMLGADHGGNRQAARDDRGMRGGAAQIGDEAGHAQIAELDGVGRRKIVGDDDQFLVLAALGQFARLAEQDLQHPFANLNHILFAFAQVRIVELVELGGQLLHLLDQGPLRIAAPIQDQGLGFVGQHRVGEDHRMQIEKYFQLGRRAGCAGLAAQRFEFGADRGEGGFQADHLARHIPLAQLVLGHFHGGVGDQLGTADGDALGDRQPEDGKSHFKFLIRPRRSGRRSAPGGRPWPPPRVLRCIPG